MFLKKLVVLVMLISLLLTLTPVKIFAAYSGGGSFGDDGYSGGSVFDDDGHSGGGSFGDDNDMRRQYDNDMRNQYDDDMRNQY